jgi:DNA-binding MarR family transcriptional regulator
MSTVEIQRRLLEEIEKNPDTTQADLAAQLDIAVGSVNGYLKHLVRKGYVKVSRLQRRKLKYLLTPHGLALKAKLTSQHIETSLQTFRELRHAAQAALVAVNEAGYTTVHLEGNDGAMEIFRLTCLEQRVTIARNPEDHTPTVRLEGMNYAVHWPEPPTHVTASKENHSL